MRKGSLVLVSVVVLGFVLGGSSACEDKGTGTTATASATASAKPSASVTASASVSASASASVSASASASASATASAPIPTGDGGAPTCGKKPLPDCPLQGWMKKNMEPAMNATDFPDIATQLDKIATFAPPGMTNWASISKDGAKAARGADLGGVKASCRSCHDQYKNKYKAEMRLRPVP